MPHCCTRVGTALGRETPVKLCSDNTGNSTTTCNREWTTFVLHDILFSQAALVSHASAAHHMQVQDSARSNLSLEFIPTQSGFLAWHSACRKYRCASMVKFNQVSPSHLNKHKHSQGHAPTNTSNRPKACFCNETCGITEGFGQPSGHCI